MSITSMNARMGMAEKLDIPQLTKAVQDGTIPSFIGIPLIQQKMKERQGAMTMQPKAPPVAQQVMQQAQAMERPQGIPALPSQMPEEYAQGGILSYAGGGDLFDDEDYDPEDEAQAEAMMQGEELMNEIAANPEIYGRSMGIDYNEAPNPQVEYHRTPTAEAVKVSKGKPDNFESLAVARGKAHGVDEHLVKHVMHKETGGLKDRAGAVSPAGAIGVMQLMPATARGLGVENPYDPEQNIEGGVKYLGQLQRKYQDPKLAAIAYNWGPGNTDKWLASGADMSRLPKETRNYVQNLSEGGIAGLAGGGAVHFVDGGDVFNMSPKEILDSAARKLRLDQLKSAFATPAAEAVAPAAAAPSFMESAKNAIGRLNPRGLVGYGSLLHTEDLNQGEDAELKRRWKEAYESPAESARLLRQNATATGTPVDRVADQAAASSAPFAGAETPDLVTGGYGASTPQTEATPPTEPTAQANPASSIEDLLAKREAGLGKQRNIDNYMALLSAGLGMMGGTSPFAAANIGQGAQAGIKTYGDAAARRAAEENAILSGRLGMYKYAGSRAQAEAMMQLRKDLQKEQLGLNRERLAQTGREHEASLAQRISAKQLDLIKNEQDRAMTTAAKLVGDNPASLSMSDAQKAEAVRNMANSLLMPNKLYRKAHISEYGADPFADMGGPSGSHPKEIQSILDKYTTK